MKKTIRIYVQRFQQVPLQHHLGLVIRSHESQKQITIASNRHRINRYNSRILCCFQYRLFVNQPIFPRTDPSRPHIHILRAGTTKFVPFGFLAGKCSHSLGKLGKTSSMTVWHGRLSGEFLESLEESQRENVKFSGQWLGKQLICGEIHHLFSIFSPQNQKKLGMTCTNEARNYWGKKGKLRHKFHYFPRPNFAVYSTHRAERCMMMMDPHLRNLPSDRLR